MDYRCVDQIYFHSCFILIIIRNIQLDIALMPLYQAHQYSIRYFCHTDMSVGDVNEYWHTIWIQLIKSLNATYSIKHDININHTLLKALHKYVMCIANRFTTFALIATDYDLRLNSYKCMNSYIVLTFALIATYFDIRLISYGL